MSTRVAVIPSIEFISMELNAVSCVICEAAILNIGHIRI